MSNISVQWFNIHKNIMLILYNDYFKPFWCYFSRNSNSVRELQIRKRKVESQKKLLFMFSHIHALETSSDLI